MWLFAVGGFFSIVQHKDDPKYLLVRSRVKGDIERYWPDADVQRTEKADYLYRAKIARVVVEEVVLNIVKNIKYTSYKGAMEDKSRYWDHYVDVSEAMKHMQEIKDGN
jgi:hypothetical protein